MPFKSGIWIHPPPKEPKAISPVFTVNQMIPPVEERAVRPCIGKLGMCVFLRLGQYHLEDECRICKESINRPENTYYSRIEYSGDNEPDLFILKNWPCKYNVYIQELEKLIASGRV